MLIEDDALVIRGEPSEECETRGEGTLRTERTYRRFYRRLPLGYKPDMNAVKAEYKDGVLELTLPVPPETKSSVKRIPVRADAEATREVAQAFIGLLDSPRRRSG